MIFKFSTNHFRFKDNLWKSINVNFAKHLQKRLSLMLVADHYLKIG